MTEGIDKNSYEQPKAVSLDWRVNVISLANFVAMLGLLLTAISTWYGLVYDVQGAKDNIAAIRETLTKNLEERSVLQQNQIEMTQRLYRIESKVEYQSSTLEDIKSSVGELEKRSVR